MLLKNIQIMIRIASTHFVEDWIDTQLTNFEKYIKEPYLVYTRMPDDPTQTGKSTASGGIIPDPIYEKHKHKFYKAIPGASRIAETTRVVLNEISKDLKDDDLVILMDADCFPISKNFISKLETKLKSADLAIA